MRSAYNVRLASAVAAPCRRIHLSYIQVSIAWGNHASPSNGKLSSLPEFGIKLLAPELESGSPEPGAPAIGNVKGSHGYQYHANHVSQHHCWRLSRWQHHQQTKHRSGNERFPSPSAEFIPSRPETSTNIASLDENFPGLQGAHSSVVKSKRCHQ